MKSIIKTLNQTRLRAEITLEEIERGTGLSVPYLSRFFSGQIKNPTVKTVLKITKFLSLKIELKEI